MRAIPAEAVAVITLPPAAAAPIQADIALCSLSTVTNSVSTFPSATNFEKSSTICVDGVIGNAATTSGLICRIASAIAPLPVIAFVVLIPSSLSLFPFKCEGRCVSLFAYGTFTDTEPAALAVGVVDPNDFFSLFSRGGQAVFQEKSLLRAKHPAGKTVNTCLRVKNRSPGSP